MAAVYIKSGAGATEFAQSTAYTAGQKIVPKRTDTGTNHLVGKRYVWECTTGGTTAAAEPTWPASVTQDVTTVTSNTAVFTARRPGFSSGTTADWSFATIYIDYPGALLASGDVAYVSHQHSESCATIIGGNINGYGVPAALVFCKFICVNDGAAPPTAAATTAVVKTTGNNSISMYGPGVYMYGITFIAGEGASGTASLSVGSFAENCSYQLGSTGASSTLTLPGKHKNCTLKFAAAGHTIAANGGLMSIEGASFLVGTVSPTNLLANINYPMIFASCDFSLLNAAVNLSSSSAMITRATFSRCKLPSGFTGALGSVSQYGNIELLGCENTALTYAYRRKTVGGDVYHETTLVRSGGATDGTTAISHKLVSTSSAVFPYIAAIDEGIAKWNDTVTGNITVTLEFLHDSATALKNNEIFMEVMYLSDSGSPIESIVSTLLADPIGTPADTTASAASWTTTGMANPNTRKLVATIAPRQKGFVVARVFLAKPSTTVYIDPKLALAAA